MNCMAHAHNHALAQKSNILEYQIIIDKLLPDWSFSATEILNIRPANWGVNLSDLQISEYGMHGTGEYVWCALFRFLDKFTIYLLSEFFFSILSSKRIFGKRAFPACPANNCSFMYYQKRFSQASLLISTKYFPNINYGIL